MASPKKSIDLAFRVGPNGLELDDPNEAVSLAVREALAKLDQAYIRARAEWGEEDGRTVHVLLAWSTTDGARVALEHKAKQQQTEGADASV